MTMKTAAMAMAAGVWCLWGWGMEEAPEPVAPFLPKEVKTIRVAPALQADGAAAGAKAVLLRNHDQSVTIGLRGKLLASFRFRVAPSEPGWQPFIKYAAKAGAETGKIEREHKFGLTKTEGGTFRQSLRVDGGKVRLESTWDARGAKTAVKSQTVEMFIPFEAIEGKTIAFTEEGGKRKVCKMPDGANWGDRGGKLWANTFQTRNPVKMEVRPDSREFGYAIEFGGTVGQIVVFRNSNGAVLHVNTKKEAMGKPLAMAVDLGETPVEEEAEKAFGIDFMANNDSETAWYDLGGNMLPNPSFESRTRYWRDMYGAAMADDWLTEDARTGKRAMVVKGRSSFCLPAKAGATYTLSAYAKSADGTGGTLWFGVRNGVFASGGNLREIRYLKGGTKDWQRVEWTFKWPYRDMAVEFGSYTGDKTIIIDDLQLEIGEKATEYKGNPFGTMVETDSPDGFYGNTNQVFNARLKLTGPAGAKGKVGVKVRDFFGREKYAGEMEFRLGDGGEWTGKLCPEETFADKGCHAIRLRVEPEGYRAYREQFRISRFAYHDGKCARRNLHQWEGRGVPAKIDERSLRREQLTGVAWRYHVVDRYAGFIPAEEGEWIRKRSEKYGHVSVEWVFSQHFDKTLEKHGIGGDRHPKKMSRFDEEYLKKVEAAVEEQVRRAPHCRVWVGPNEVGQSWETTRLNNYEEYAKILMRVQRTVKRVNPENKFVAYSVCNLEEQGRREIHDFLAAGLRVDPEFRFDGVDVHPYRAHPEFPDLDADFELLYADLDRLGYTECTVWALEGAYFYPLCVGEWQGMAPWQDTFTKDGFAAMHLPSYDLGWGERMSAAMLLRYNLICYKYAERLAAATCWGFRVLDAYNPLAAFVATSAQLSLLGDSKYRGESRFAPGARAYLFDDGHGKCVAAVWSFSEGQDYGTSGGNRMRLEWKGEGLEVFDMMGNARKPFAGGEGAVELPLSNHPLYLRVDGARGDELMKALNESEVLGRKDVALGFAVKPHGLDRVKVKVTNPLSREFAGTLRIGAGGVARKFGLGKRESRDVEYVLEAPMKAGVENRIELPIRVEEGESELRRAFKFGIVPVRKCAGRPDWAALPEVELKHVALETAAKRMGMKHGGPDDLSAGYKVAWSDEGLHMLITVKDDVFANLLERKFGMVQWYDNDSVQLFFDTLGDAPQKAIAGVFGLDDNDMSYELLPTNAVGGVVYRRQAPDHQLTGGVTDGLRKNTVEPGVRMDFRWDEAKRERRYETFFPKRQLMPVDFRAHTTFGLGIKVYDRDDMGPTAKQTIGNVPPEDGDAMSVPHKFTTLYLLP